VQAVKGWVAHASAGSITTSAIFDVEYKGFLVVNPLIPKPIETY
jgi:hypothetical protein